MFADKVNYKGTGGTWRPVQNALVRSGTPGYTASLAAVGGVLAVVGALGWAGGAEGAGVVLLLGGLLGVVTDAVVLPMAARRRDGGA